MRELSEAGMEEFHRLEIVLEAIDKRICYRMKRARSGIQK